MKRVVLGLLLGVGMASCGGDDSSGGDGASGGDDGTGDDGGTTGSDGGTGDGTGGGSSDDGSGDSSSGTTDDEGSTSGTGGSTGTTTSDPGTTASTGSSSNATTGSGLTMVLDPDTMEFFDLPIGSVRYAVGGEDLASDTCVTLVWVFGGSQWDEICDEPYVIVTPAAQAPCTQWDYGPNVTVESHQGCVQFMDTMPLTATVDVTVEVSGAAFTGTIIANNL